MYSGSFGGWATKRVGVFRTGGASIDRKCPDDDISLHYPPYLFFQISCGVSRIPCRKNTKCKYNTHIFSPYFNISDDWIFTARSCVVRWFLRAVILRWNAFYIEVPRSVGPRSASLPHMNKMSKPFSKEDYFLGWWLIILLPSYVPKIAISFDFAGLARIGGIF